MTSRCIQTEGHGRVPAGSCFSIVMCGLFRALQNVLGERKMSTARGSWDRKSAAQECTIPSEQEPERPRGGARVRTKHSRCLQGCTNKWRHWGNSPRPAFLAAAAHREPASLRPDRCGSPAGPSSRALRMAKNRAFWSKMQIGSGLPC